MGKAQPQIGVVTERHSRRQAQVQSGLATEKQSSYTDRAINRNCGHVVFQDRWLFFTHALDTFPDTTFKIRLHTFYYNTNVLIEPAILQIHAKFASPKYAVFIHAPFMLSKYYKKAPSSDTGMKQKECQHVSAKLTVKHDSHVVRLGILKTLFSSKKSNMLHFNTFNCFICFLTHTEFKIQKCVSSISTLNV